MQVDAVRLTPANLSLCAPLWGGREAFVGDELERALAAAGRLLAEDKARGAIVFEDECPRAFGITVFADEAFVSNYLSAVHPHVGKRLLLGAHDPASTAVLGRSQVAERNAGTGLQLVVANTAYDVAAHEPDTVLGRLIAAFHDTHRGYRLARIINEVFGQAAMAVVEASRAYETIGVFEQPAPGSLVGALTRQQAASSTNLLAMFAYSPPRLFCTAAEQQLIAAALAGDTDETLSRRLGIPVSAVKARWCRIQDRVARRAPELFRGVRGMPAGTGRGVQTRHLILEYVRNHPSELTPYAVRLPFTRRRPASVAG
jgi:hypothetical protein